MASVILFIHFKTSHQEEFGIQTEQQQEILGSGDLSAIDYASSDTITWKD